MTAAFVMLLGAGRASASLEPAGTVRTEQAAGGSGVAQQLKQAFSDLGNGDYAKATPELDQLIASPDFGQLTAEVRFQVINVAAAIALQDKDYPKAHRLGMMATGFDQASSATWLGRLFAAFFIGDNADAARCVEAVAKQWPDRLDAVRPQGITQLHHALRVAHESEVDRSMLNALFDANWQAGQSTYDFVWRDLVLMQIEHNHDERAAVVAQRIRSAATALSMRVDKRFDAITLRYPERFDVIHLLDAQIEAARERIKSHPDQLEPVQRLQDLLLEKARNAEVLAVSEAAVKHAESGDGEKTYTDFDEAYNWVLNQRSLALAHEGRWDDAVREMARAAKRPESGGVNVSQSINLAGLYVDLAEPDKAAAAIVEPGQMSPMGRMQLHYAKLLIAIEKNEAPVIAEHLAYLRKHRTDDIATWQRALLRRGDLDGAAAVLIERLNSPEWRNSALVGMQHYVRGKQTPTMKTMEQRWNAVTSRADVQAAVAKVGRIERFAITAPAY
jgi:tetratricopeptide (TPR) repeat protein